MKTPILKLLCALAGAIAVMTTPVSAQEPPPPSLDALAFLEGAWRSNGDFVFEETWSAAAGGVMTGMARGMSGDKLAVLEYLLIIETQDAIEMRFKHFNADYSTWEKDGPIILTLTSFSDNDATFTADPPSETVKSIRYQAPSSDRLQADVVLVKDGEESGFSLTFHRLAQ